MQHQRNPTPACFERTVALSEELFPRAKASLKEKQLLDIILKNFYGDNIHYSDILEWSISQAGDLLDQARFSYAFPGYITNRQAVARSVLDIAQVMGNAASKASLGLLRAAQHPSVQQILVGYAQGGGAQPRFKLYLQFRDQAGASALKLAELILNTPLSTRSNHLPLHLLGLDIGDEGLAGAKLYFAHQGAQPEILGVHGNMHQALWIHRMLYPGDPSANPPTELDFALDSPEFSDLAAQPAMFPYKKLSHKVEQLASSFSLRFRRASFGLDASSPKLNTYYVLDEAEPLEARK